MVEQLFKSNKAWHKIVGVYLQTRLYRRRIHFYEISAPVFWYHYEELYVALKRMFGPVVLENNTNYHDIHWEIGIPKYSTSVLTSPTNFPWFYECLLFKRV